MDLLQSKFVVAWTNNHQEKYVGDSKGYHRRKTAVGTTNGAGARNVQIFILSKDLHVLHALPGFWHPREFERALRFGLALDRLWRDEGRTLQEKRRMFARLQLSELRSQSRSPAIAARSGWQGFDGHSELRRHKMSPRDTVDSSGKGLKPINQIVQERMASRPFVPFADFDIANFAEIGSVIYDLNRRVDGAGRDFWFADRNLQNHAKKAREERAAYRRFRVEELRRGRADR